MKSEIKILSYPYVVKCENPTTAHGYLGTGEFHMFNVEIGDGFYACKAYCDHSNGIDDHILVFFNFNGDVIFYRDNTDITGEHSHLDNYKIMFRSPDQLQVIMKGFENERYTIIK